MDELGPVLSLVSVYREYSAVVTVYDRDRQGFQHTLAKHYASLLLEGVLGMLTRVYNMGERAE